MRKFLKPKEILLLGLANLLDAAEEIQDPFRLMSSSYKNMYGWVPTRYRKHNFYQLISRSLRTRFIEKIEKDGEIYIRITTEGKKTIQRDFPMLLLQNRKWDRKWRIVMFDVEEINKKVRDRLRRKLKELGFGMLQKSVFISPHDIVKDFSEFAESAGINDYLYLLETHKLIIGDEREFANKVWRLEELNKKYKDVIDEIDKINSFGPLRQSFPPKARLANGGSEASKLRINAERNRSISPFDKLRVNAEQSPVPSGAGQSRSINNSHMISISDRVKKSDGKREEEIRSVKAKWLKIVISDPFLPKMFLPKPWYGDQAERSVKRLTL